jgi:phosphotransferase system enzyme I (PtsP)
MVEVPSLLFTIDEIAARADFMSVGSNDLMQFLFAADRDNQQLAGRFDSCNPACLRALKMVADAGAKAGIPVTLCGELAGRPVDAMVLLALGYRGLSMSPLSIGPVKAMILDLELAPVRHNIETLLRDNPAAASLREDIIGMARNMGLV